MKKTGSTISCRLFSAVIICMLPFLSGCENLQAGNKAGKIKQVQAEDSGKKPWVLDIDKATVGNNNYRSVKWTGQGLQLVLMSVKPGEEIDLEMHAGVDQFLRIEQGEAQVLMGKTKQDLSFNKKVFADWAILIPAGYYHNIKNTGKTDLKLYSIYAPANHPAGTIHKTHLEARKAHSKEKH